MNTVVFDVGETLVDETNLWAGWAEWLGVPAFTLYGVLGGLAARGEDHQRFVELLKPGATFTQERAAKEAAGSQRLIDELGLPVDAVVSSGGLGVEKPAAGFFTGAAAAVGATVSDCVQHADDPAIELQVSSLTELPPLLRTLR